MTRCAPFHALAPALGLFALSALATPAHAQQTWIVDASGGGNFTTLDPALDIAASGDEIVIRGGGTFPNLYIAFQKSLRIRAEGGRPLLTRGISFAYVPASAPSPITLSGLDLGAVFLRECAATFAAEDCTIGSFTALSCAGAALNRCSFGLLAREPGFTPLSITSTPLALSSCAAVGGSALCATLRPPFTSPIAGAPAIFAQQSTVMLADTTLQGGDGALLSCGVGDSAGALYLIRAELHATRSTLSGGRRSGVVGLGATLEQSRLVFDPSAVLVGPVLNVGSTTTTRSIPAALGVSAAPGGTLSYRHEGQPSTAAALFASLALTPPLAIDLGPLWLTTSPTLLLQGTTDASGRLAGTLAIPALVPHGTVLVLQGLEASNAAPGLLLSTAVVLQAL
ncbi:MAG: hypothetical protein JNM84_10665 [Planctomycetes bacterium]|nr:hypothetical protein [Planctomycetota bacterium]